MPSQEEEQGHQGNDFASRGVAAASSPGPSRRSPGERGEERAPLAAELRHACAARELATAECCAVRRWRQRWALDA